MSHAIAKKIDFTSGKLLKKMIAFAVPIAVATILQMLFNAADIAIVGQFSGEKGSVYQGAVGATTTISHLVVNLFVGVSTGAGVVMANAFGAKDEKRQQRVVHSSMALALVSGFIIMPIGMIACNPLLALMQTPADVIDYSTIYLIIYFAGAPGMMVYNFCASLLRGVGDTKKPLFYLVISGVLNVIVNIITVVVLHMNVAGVAIATTLSQYVSAVLVVRDLLKADGGLKFSFKKIAFHGKVVKKILLLGVPMGLSSCCFSLSNILIQSSINSFGSMAIAGNANAGNIEGFVDAFAASCANTVVTAVGQNMGAKKGDRINKTVGAGLIMCITIQVICVLILLFFGKYLCMIYNSDPEVLVWAMKRLHTVSCFAFLTLLLHIFGGALRGMGYSIFPLLINIFFTCILRVIYMVGVFPFLPHEIEYILIAYPVTWILSGIFQMILYFICRKKVALHFKEEIKENEKEVA